MHWVFCRVRVASNIFQYHGYIAGWIIYCDLTVTSMEWWLVRGIIPKCSYFSHFQVGELVIIVQKIISSIPSDNQMWQWKTLHMCRLIIYMIILAFRRPFIKDFLAMFHDRRPKPNCSVTWFLWFLLIRLSCIIGFCCVWFISGHVSV